MTTDDTPGTETSRQPLRSERVDVPSASGRPMRAALVRPHATGPRPAVIVIHEAFGLNRDIRDKAGRLARMGYVALAPDLFDKGQPKALCIARTMRQMGRGGGEALDDLEAIRNWLAGQLYVDEFRTGVIGFCMGGAFALLYAGRAPLNAAAIFYGSAPPDTGEGSIYEDMCPVVASYGARDRTLRGHSDRLEAALEKRGIDHDIKTYEDAGHSFMSDHKGLFARLNAAGPLKLGFQPEAAEDSWQRVETFFAKHLDA